MADCRVAHKVMVAQSVNWSQAKGRCEGLGAHLATVTDSAEHALLTTAAGWAVWIGMSETDEEGTLRWVTREPITYTGFTSPPVLDGDTHCVELEKPGTWAIIPCVGRSRRYICEAE